MIAIMTQMNVRIETDVKKLGDRALVVVKSTPSQPVRWLWELAETRALKPRPFGLGWDRFRAEQPEANVRPQTVAFR